MPIAVTCECGAKLEIDEKFRGKQILCPDCQRPLATTPPPSPPPLELPDYRRVNGWAILSLVLALAGAFTIVGSLAAVGVGIYALKQIGGKPGRFDGANLARAGIYSGAFFTLLTCVALFSPTVFGIDAFLREMQYAGRIQYSDKDVVESTDSNRTKMKLTVPTPIRRWAKYNPPTTANEKYEGSDILLVNVIDDAFIAYFEFEGGGEADGDGVFQLVINKLHNSDLIYLLTRASGKPPKLEPKNVEKKPLGGDKYEATFEMRLAGVERRFLLEYAKVNNNSIRVFIGAARTNRFTRMSEVFRKTFDSQAPGD